MLPWGRKSPTRGRGAPISPAGPSLRRVPMHPVQVLPLEEEATSIIGCLKKSGADVQAKTSFHEEPPGFITARPEEGPFPSLHMDLCTRCLIRGSWLQDCCLLCYFFLLLNCFYFSMWKSYSEQNLRKQVKSKSFCQNVWNHRVEGRGVSMRGSGQLQLWQRPCFFSFFA